MADGGRVQPTEEGGQASFPASSASGGASTRLQEAQAATNTTRAACSALSASEKERVGRCCKRLIDMGRVWFVRKVLGLQARLVCYAPESITPENVLLLAHP